MALWISKLLRQILWEQAETNWQTGFSGWMITKYKNLHYTQLCVYIPYQTNLWPVSIPYQAQARQENILHVINKTLLFSVFCNTKKCPKYCPRSLFWIVLTGCFQNWLPISKYRLQQKLRTTSTCILLTTLYHKSWCEFTLQILFSFWWNVESKDIPKSKFFGRWSEDKNWNHNCSPFPNQKMLPFNGTKGDRR